MVLALWNIEKLCFSAAFNDSITKFIISNTIIKTQMTIVNENICTLYTNKKQPIITAPENKEHSCVFKIQNKFAQVTEWMKINEKWKKNPGDQLPLKNIDMLYNVSFCYNIFYKITTILECL